MTAVTTPATTARPKRDPWFDNAKMALVLLVVLGHAWTLLPPSALNAHLYDFLYAWHVPAFVFVTGYLSRSFDWSRLRLWQLFCTVLVPYVVFECALALFRVHVGGEDLDRLFADPHWPMWYLAALFFWRLLTPIFKNLRGGVLVAVAISLLAGLYAGDTLDVARILGLLPFFVIGLQATPERLERLRAWPVQLVGVLVLVGIWVATTWTDRWVSTEWFYYRSRYDEMGTSDLEAMITRAVLLAVGLAGAFAFLAVIPRAGGWFARMGAWTLVVYLFHGFAVKGAAYAGYGEWAADRPAFALVLTTTAAAVGAMALAWHPVASRLGRLVDPFGYAQHKLRAAVHVAAAKGEADVFAGAIEGAAAREPVHTR